MDISRAGNYHGYYHGSNTPLGILGKTDDYVPLFTIYAPTQAPVDLRSLPASDLKERLGVRANKANITPLDRIIVSKACEAAVDGFEYYREFLKSLRESVQELVHDEDLEFQIKKGGIGGTSYQNLFDYVLTDNYWRTTRLRSGRYFTNLWFLALAKTNVDQIDANVPTKIETLSCMMVKREMVPYVRMCYLLGEPPHPDSLELWVRDDLDVPKGNYKNMRPHYRRILKKEAVESGIQIVELPSLDDVMYHTIKQPKFTRISERSNWAKERGAEFLSARETTKRVRRHANIELIA